MPFVRFSRDRRGYEHTYLVDVSPRDGKPSSRLLYWFRTPPGVKVGREPFDAEMRRTLESRYPDLTFDWKTIVGTPIPAPTVDWRSRRRADRAEKAARRVAELENVADVEDEIADVGDLENGADPEQEDGEAPLSVQSVGEAAPPGATDAGNGPGGGARRRRRRGGRHHRRASAGDALSAIKRGSEELGKGSPSDALIAAGDARPPEGTAAGPAGSTGRAAGTAAGAEEAKGAGEAGGAAATKEAAEAGGRGKGGTGNWPTGEER